MDGDGLQLTLDSKCEQHCVTTKEPKNAKPTVDMATYEADTFVKYRDWLEHTTNTDTFSVHL